MAVPLTSNSLFLALETSGSLGSVAVASGGRVLAHTLLEGQVRHAAELVPCVAGVLEKAGVARSQLSGVVVGSGPGSFTGVRVAAATGKGIAHALDIPMWAFSSLEAAAAAELVLPPPPQADAIRYVLFDARADRVYAACYRLSAAAVVEVVAPQATSIGTLLSDALPPHAWFVGDGALRHEALIQAKGHPVLPPPAGVPSAEALILLLALRPQTAPVGRPDRWEPAYVRPSSAERARVG